MPASDALAAAVKAGVLGQAEADRLAAFLAIFILGGALLLLGVGWRTLRRLAIGMLMPPAFARRLPTI